MRHAAVDIEWETLKPSSRYLLAMYCQPRTNRQRGLLDAAQWFRLDETLSKLAPGAEHRDIEARWLDLLDACAEHLQSGTEVRELRALTRALRILADLADHRRKDATLRRLWETMSDELNPSTSTRRSGTEVATLRGRKWSALRESLSRVLAAHNARAAPESLLPRAPRQPSMFPDDTYSVIAQELRHQARGSGLGVIVAPPGSGRTELALAYATAKLRDHTYDQVFVLRATNPLRLEQDFMIMAEKLTGPSNDRVRLRRDALTHLKENNRWLIVFTSVQDPAILLPFFPVEHRRAYSLHVLASAPGAKARPISPQL